MLVRDPKKAQAIVHAFSDEYARRIIVSTALVPKCIEEISEEQLIPISTCYRRVHELVDEGILLPDKKGSKVLVSSIGEEEEKEIASYRCTFLNAMVRLEKGELVVDVDQSFLSSQRSKMEQQQEKEEKKKATDNSPMIQATH